MVRQHIAAAASQWASASAFTFTETDGSPDILVSFVNMGATLYTTTAPQNGGFVTLNYARSWSTSTLPPAGAVDLPTVLVHALGHVLGFQHSEFADAVMFASVGVGRTTKRTLAMDDIQGALALNIEWTPFDDFGDIEAAFNAHPGGTSIWMLGGDSVPGGKQVWENTGNWALHGGGAIHIAVNATSPQNIPWIVTDTGAIGRFNWGTDNFDTIPGCATDIGVGDDDSVWIVGCTVFPGSNNDNTLGIFNREVLKFNGNLTCSTPSNCWTRVAENKGGYRISVGPREPNGPNVPWIINNGFRLLRGRDRTRGHDHLGIHPGNCEGHRSGLRLRLVHRLPTGAGRVRGLYPA